MDRFIMVKQLEIKMPEPQKNSDQEELKEKILSKVKKCFDFFRKISGLLHAAPLTL